MLSSQVFSRQTDGQTDRQKPIKQYAPDLSMQGHKNEGGALHNYVFA